MTFNNLKDVYIDQLQDLYSADRQAVAATRQLVDAASEKDLKDALKRSHEGTERGIEILEGLIKSHGENPKGEFCKGMEGIVKEVKAHALDADFSDDDVRDAVIITQYQRMAHYALAGYGCVAAFAKRLGLTDDAAKIEECLDNTYKGDREMTRIAEGEVNKEAA